MDPKNANSNICLVCHPQTIKKIVEAGIRSKIGEYWGLVHGRPPAIPLPEADSADGIQTLLKPTAIYQGLKRPLHHGHMNADADVLIYVANPPHTCLYKDHKDFGGILETARAPVSSVFTTFVSLNEAHVDGALQGVRDTRGHNVAGVVLFWEWTESDPQHPEIPYDSDNRYARGIYRKALQ